jgi:hypothetical protein
VPAPTFNKGSGKVPYLKKKSLSVSYSASSSGYSHTLRVHVFTRMIAGKQDHHA